MKEFSKSLRLTIILIVFFGGCYPLFIWAIGRLVPDKADGLPVIKNGKLVGYELVGMKFTEDKYFWGRPSAVDYNAASTGGSNQGPTNPAHLEAVKARIDSFLVHNPTIKASDIPADLVTASGSGLDPDISEKAALIQVPRVAKSRSMAEDKIRQLVEDHTNKPVFGMQTVNVATLNRALDELK